MEKTIRVVMTISYDDEQYDSEIKVLNVMVKEALEKQSMTGNYDFDFTIESVDAITETN